MSNLANKLTEMHDNTDAIDNNNGQVSAPHADLNLPDRPKAKWLSARGLGALLSLADYVVLCLGMAISLELLTGNALATPLNLSIPYILFPVILVWLGQQFSAYDISPNRSFFDMIGRIGWATSFALGIVLSIALFSNMGGPFSYFAVTTALCGALVVTLHIHVLSFDRSMRSEAKRRECVVIIGATSEAQEMIERNAIENNFTIAAIFDDRLSRAPKQIGEIPVIGTVDDLMTWDELPKIDKIVISVTSTAQSRVSYLIEKMRPLPQQVLLLLDLKGFAPEFVNLADINGAPAAYISGAPENRRRAVVKRAFDIFVSASLLVGFMPLFLIVGALIKLDSKGPILFRQRRHGFNNEVINVYKFRSMRPDKLAEDGIITQVSIGDSRVTNIGKFIRKTSIDELPQLVNVLKGEMSLVGPRPHAVGMTTEEMKVHEIVALYAHRHRVKPGLTGWAQINGSRGPVHVKHEVTERVDYDLEYIKRSSFWFDLYIMVMTIPCLLGDSIRPR